MFENNLHRKEIALVLFMVLAALAFMGFVDAAGQRVPIPPRPPADPPQTTPGTGCVAPSELDDIPCKAPGKGQSIYAQQAMDFALLMCDPIYVQCTLSQARELVKNRKKCETDDAGNLNGCKLTSKLSQDSHQCSGSIMTDCEPRGEAVVAPGTMFTCQVNGKYDITDYKCEKPAPAPSPGTAG